ncbi:MAG TPA: hypothetical protein VGW38_15755 [Chloroflexota bacterium]|nr:hypothetical protein [Chloroflexota bacterium]
MPAVSEGPLITCPNGHTLGALVAGMTVIRHRGREWVGIPLSIRCECGAVWQPPAETLRGVVEDAGLAAGTMATGSTAPERDG